MAKRVHFGLGAVACSLVIGLSSAGCGADEAAITNPDSGDDTSSAADAASPDGTTPDSATADAPDGSTPDSATADTGSDGAVDGGTDGSTDGQLDSATEGGSGDGGDGGGVGPLCPPQTCPVSDQCCAEPVDGGISLGCQAACPGDVIGCTKPSDCPGGTPICCATVTLTGGTLPACTVGAATSSCAAQCTDTFNFSCVTTDIVRLCSAASDCAGNSFGNTFCCRFSVAPTPFCVSSTLMGFASQCL